MVCLASFSSRGSALMRRSRRLLPLLPGQTEYRRSQARACQQCVRTLRDVCRFLTPLQNAFSGLLTSSWNTSNFNTCAWYVITVLKVPGFS